MPSIALNIHLILTTTQWGRYAYYSHFSDEKDEAQRGSAAFPKSHSQEVVESGHKNPGRLTPAHFERCPTLLTLAPAQVNEAGAGQSPFVPEASVSLSLLLYHCVPGEERAGSSPSLRWKVGGEAFRRWPLGARP